jgi:two-component system, response regulator RegA
MPTIDSRRPVEMPTDRSLLIVDDDAVLAHRLGQALVARGFEARVACSVRDGLLEMQARPPHFAIFDLRLQDGSGIDLMAALRDLRADARAIILTGYGNIATAVAAAKQGAIDYLPKPSDADEIMDALLAPDGQLANPPETPQSPQDFRLEHINSVLAQCENNLSMAARQLSMHRRTLQRIMRREGKVPAREPV